MSDVTHTSDLERLTWLAQINVLHCKHTLRDESHHTHECVMSHVFMSYVTHTSDAARADLVRAK